MEQKEAELKQKGEGGLAATARAVAGPDGTNHPGRNG